MATQSSSSATIELPTLLLVLFVALKLTHVIAWSWWWVLSPIWIPLGIAAVVVLVILFAAAVK